MSRTKSFLEIQNKINRGEAVVLTSEEVCKRVRDGETINFDDVDVVTTATRGIMSGTYIVLSFKVAEPNEFKKASSVWINGIPAYVGPCPNERLGVLDLIVYGTGYSKYDSSYGGGHLFKEMVEGKTIEVEVETVEGYCFKHYTDMNEIPYAKYFATRHTFKNYLAFVNPSSESLSTIFHAADFKGNYSEATFCGCGEMNPIKNDPDLETIGIGTRVLINGAEGFVIGNGTRSSPDNPNLAAFADLHPMDGEYMGGYLTPSGPEIISTWAVPIPIINERILENVIKLDKETPLKVADVGGRFKLCETTYGDVWNNADPAVTYEPEKCIMCTTCEIEEKCPMQAVNSGNSVKPATHEPSECFNCGFCVSVCPGGAFNAELGAIHCTIDNVQRTIPVTLRQSDRLRAIRAASELKEQILDSRFRITEPVERISFGPSFEKKN